MNNITLAHIGGELVLVGGIAFYFHKKTSMLQQEIALLKKEMQANTETIEELQDAIQRLGAMVVALQRRPQQPVSRQEQTPVAPAPAVQTPITPPQQAPVQASAPTTQFVQSKPNTAPSAVTSMLGMMHGLMEPEQTGPVTFPPPRKDKKKRRPLKEDSDSGEETYDDKDLDKELANEYERLSVERQNSNKVCEGDTCKIVD